MITNNSSVLQSLIKQNGKSANSSNLIGLINNYSSRKSTLMQSRNGGNTDKTTVSNSAAAFYETEQILKNIQEKEGYSELKAKDNVLSFPVGNYRYTCKDGSPLYLKQSDGLMATDFLTMHNKYGILGDGFSESYLANERRYATFFTFLQHDVSAINLRERFSDADNLEILGSVGITPGWFTIISEQGNSFNSYLGENGHIYPGYDIESRTMSLTNHNFFADNGWRGDIGAALYTEDTVFLINGEEYKLDKNGYLHIPEGTPVTGFKVIY